MFLEPTSMSDEGSFLLKKTTGSLTAIHQLQVWQANHQLQVWHANHQLQAWQQSTNYKSDSNPPTTSLTS